MNPQPLNPTLVPEVPLPRAPLARVIAQIQFPTILAIRNPDKVTSVQEDLRKDYPFLKQEQVRNIEVTSDQTPNVHHSVVWRFADRETNASWRVSLSVDFVAIETSSYISRSDFLNRLDILVSSVNRHFKPESASRLGLRYIARLIDDAIERVEELVHPKVLGIHSDSNNLEFVLGNSIIHSITDTQFLAPEDAYIQGRWGRLPAGRTYDPNVLDPFSKPSWILDLDMFKSNSIPFTNEVLLPTATDFAKNLYWVFRQMVTEEFLKYYGGEI